MALWVLTGSLVQAQAPRWRQPQELIARTGSLNIQASVTDAQGNVYLTGCFGDTARLGAVLLVGVGHWNVFVAKWSADQRCVVWAQQLAAGPYDCAGNIAVAGSSVYVTGSFHAYPADAVNDAVSHYPSRSFLAKLTDEGNRATVGWTQEFGGAQSVSVGRDVVVSGASLYLIGTTSRVSGLPSDIPLPDAAAYGQFVLKVIDDGPTARQIWITKPIAPIDSAIWYLQDLAVVGKRLYVLGTTVDERRRPTATKRDSPGYQSAQYAMFLSRLTDTDSLPHRDWTVRGNGTGNCLTVMDHTLYVAGSVSSGNHPGQRPAFTIGYHAEEDLFVAKMSDEDSTAHFRWVQCFGGRHQRFQNGVSQVLVRGQTIFLAGDFTAATFRLGTIELTNTTTRAQGYRNAFVAKLHDADTASRFVWAQQIMHGGEVNSTVLTLRKKRLYLTSIKYFTPRKVALPDFPRFTSTTDSYVQAWLPAGR